MVAFNKLQDTLAELGLKEAKHKASPPAQVLVWLGLQFNTRKMTVSIPPVKLREIMDIVFVWASKKLASRQQLQSILGKLFHVAQCCPPAHLFLSRMLATLHDCPIKGTIMLHEDFHKDLHWFQLYLPSTNGIFMLENSHPTPPPLHIYVDSCTSGCGGLLEDECYHALYPEHIVEQNLEICHLEMLNCVVALKLWVSKLNNSTVQLHCDSMVTVSVLQSGRGRDTFLLKCAREIWLLCATEQISLSVIHEPGINLSTTADALSRQHLAPKYIKKWYKTL